MVNVENIKTKNITNFLGSIQLAIPLLTIIILILIGATWYESQVGSSVVQQEIYKSPWFGFLIFLLATNLGVSALNRHPWLGSRKIGFALTHLGLIVIIAGSAAVIHLGKEGLILLDIDRGAHNQVRVEGELLEVINSQGKLNRSDLFIKTDGTLSQQKFAGLALLKYEDNTIKTYEFLEQGKVNNPAIKLTLNSEKMGQTIEQWLSISPVGYSQVDLGPATLKIKQLNGKQEWANFLKSLSQDNKSNLGKINIISNQNLIANIDVEDNLGNQIKVNHDLQVKIIDFWSDFRLDKNKNPINATEELKNPAVALELISEEGKEKWFVFANNKFPPVRSLIYGEMIEELNINYELNTNLGNNYFQVIVTDQGKTYYVVKSPQSMSSGELILNKPIRSGWSDFQITATEFIEHAEINRTIVPTPNNIKAGIPALLIATESGEKTWLPWGEPTIIKDTNEGEIYASFGAKLMELPFKIALEDFIVERNEGSESVAMWTSKIRLEDPVNNSIVHRRVWMNHPTWYHGWKIAQASWNPGDLSQSTLQVKREPAWVTALTWTGSALVIIGIAWIFYGPSISKYKLKNKPSLETKELELSGNK